MTVLPDHPDHAATVAGARDADPSASGESYPRQAARTRRFALGVPRSVTVSPDGRRVVFVRSQAGDDPAGALHVVDVVTERERLVVDPRDLLTGGDEQLAPAERARRERMRETTSGIVGYTTDRSVSRAVFALSGQLYAADLTGSEPVRRLAAPRGVVDPRLSPDGRWVAYVVEGRVEVVDWSGEQQRALAVPETEHVTYGLADFVAAEEFGRSRGLWWSPDSDAVLAERVDEAAVPVWWIADPVHPDRAPRPHRYPAAGAANPDVSVHLLDLDGTRRELPWEHERFCYLTDISWTRYGDPLLVVLDRSQRHRAVLAHDLAAGESRLVAEHTDDAWVECSPGRVRWSADGRLLAIRADRRADTYRLTIDGEPVTAPRTQVMAILDVAERDLLLLVQTHSTRAKVAVLNLATRRLRRITEADAWETGRRSGGTVVIASTTWKSTRTSVAVHRRDGTSFELRSYAETPVVTPSLRPGSTLLLAGPRELATAVLWPRDHEPGSRRLPVVMSPYGGPGHVEVAAGLGRFGEEQWLADQGFAVIVADGRGTPGRGPAWERAIAGDLATAPLEDQVAALHAVAAAHPDDIDTGRVGIRGWSFGGFLAALAVLRCPEVFHAAVAGAPVTDWRRYDTAYTERYLGLPAEHPAAYDRSSLLSDAPALRRPLLLLHGMTDDNVVVAHTLALSAALTAAGRLHTVIPLSGVTHFTPDPVITENRLLLELDFLRRSLQGG